MSCETLSRSNWISLARVSTGCDPDSACAFMMVQQLQRVLTRWRPFADAGSKQDVVLSDRCLITVTLK